MLPTAKKRTTRKKTTPQKKINLALQGGGSHGAFSWGILDYLLEDGLVTIDSISAVSAGAVNAAIIAQGFIDGGNEGARQALSKFWKELSQVGQLIGPQKTPFEQMMGTPTSGLLSYNLFELMTQVFSPYQFNPFNINPLKSLLDANIDFDKIHKSNKIKLFISATNVKTGKIKVFTNENLNREVVLASACIPTIFQAVRIEGEYYWDGGYTGNPAIFPLLYHSDVCDILILHLTPIIRDEVPKSVPEILNRLDEISFNSSLMREIRVIAFITELLDKNKIKENYREHIKRVFLHSIRADEVLSHTSNASKLNTDWPFISELFEIGRKAGKEWLDKNYSKIGKKSTIDLHDFL